MNALAAHAEAAHHLGDAFEGQSAQRTDTDAALMLMSIATAYRVAARSMEAAIRAEGIATAAATRCTLPHTGKGACPACKAMRT